MWSLVHQHFILGNKKNKMDTCFPLLKLKQLCESNRREGEKRETPTERREESTRERESPMLAH